MAKVKEQKPVAELYSETITNYSLEDRMKLLSLLTTGITNEATALKEEGERGAKILETINGEYESRSNRL
jgi:hypothetical protein